jgi:hypothetical protein
MTFPGIGRAVQVGGSLGGGDNTNRTTDWSTYDATEDTAWQQWQDESSTSIDSTHDVTASKGSSLSYSKTRAFLAINKGTTQYLGYVKLDKADADSCQIVLNGGYAMGDINIAGKIASTVVTTGIEDNGCLVAFQESLDSVTDGGKITDLNPFSDGSTDAIQTDQAFKQWSYVVRAPLGHHYTSYNGNFWPQGTDAGNGKLGVPANAHTHYIFFAQSMKGEFLNNYSTMNRVPIMAVWRTDDINDLVSSPSSALELFTDINQAYSGGSALDEYVKDEWVVGRTSHMQNRQQLSYTENGQVYLNYNDRYGAHFDFIIDGPGTPQFNTDTTPFRRYTLTSDVERRGSVVNAPDPANDIKHHKVWFIEDVGAGAKGVATDQFPYYDFYWRNVTTWKGSNNTSANYGINLLLNKPDDINRTVEQNNKLQMIKIQDSIIALYGDVTGATDQMGVPYIYGMTGNPNPLTGQTYNTNGASDKTLVEDRMEWYNTTSNFKTQDTGISDIAVTVSDTNSSDSSNTAYEPDSIKMAQLAGDYFAVVWRKSTTAYISVFEVNHQTSDQPTFTRHADSVNLGTVPEGNISITPMGDGVAVLTCGNYYRIIKTDAI